LFFNIDAQHCQLLAASFGGKAQVKKLLTEANKAVYRAVNALAIRGEPWVGWIAV
jgi:hypothetical protein